MLTLTLFSVRGTELACLYDFAEVQADGTVACREDPSSPSFVVPRTTDVLLTNGVLLKNSTVTIPHLSFQGKTGFLVKFWGYVLKDTPEDKQMQLFELWWLGYPVLSLSIDSLAFKLDYRDITTNYGPSVPLPMASFRRYGEWRLFETQLTFTLPSWSATLRYHRRNPSNFYTVDTSAVLASEPLIFSIDSVQALFGISSSATLSTGEA